VIFSWPPKLSDRQVSLAFMATQLKKPRLRTIVALGVLAVTGLAGCGAAREPNAILNIGSRNLRCPQSDLETALQRQSSETEEYYVGCDFMYTRVLCDKRSAACHPAKPQPPCFGGGCFKENPITFEWELDDTVASNTAVLDDRELLSSP
jgi:hypothetical protein